MSGGLLILILISFILLFFTCIMLTVAIGYFIAFRRRVPYLFAGYIWVVFGMAWIGTVVSSFLEVALEVGILSSSRIDQDAVNTSWAISLFASVISLGVGMVIYNFSQRNPSNDKS